jgi:hypothetical protein
MFVVSFVLWFVNLGKAWMVLAVCFGVFLLCIILATPLFYFFKFRPTPKAMARMLDSNYGLEERMITGLELQGDTSYIAKAQRNDMLVHLSASVATKKLAIVLPLAAIISVSASGVFAGGMTAVTALSAEEILPSGGTTIKNIVDPEPERYINIRYVIRGITEDYEIETDIEAEIDGDDDQIIAIGGDATAVIAEALDTDYNADEYFWAFIGWTDMDFAELEELTNDALDTIYSDDPAREDTSVTLDDFAEYEIDDDGNYVITHYAVFYQVSLGDSSSDGSGDGDSDDSEQQDSPQDSPDDQSDSEEQEGDSDNSSSEGGSDGAGKPEGSSSEKVVDGDQDYRDRYEEYYEQAMQILEEGGEIPDWLKKIVETYYGILL